MITVSRIEFYPLSAKAFYSDGSKQILTTKEAMELAIETKAPSTRREHYEKHYD